MKRFLLLIVFLAFSQLLTKADSWDDFTNVDRMWDGQKSITNQEFDQVVEKLEEKGKLQEEKKQKKKRKKLFGGGSTLHTELNPDNNVMEIESIDKEEDLVLNSPVQLIIGKNLLEKGFYKVVGERNSDDKKLYVNFYQSQFLKAKVQVVETEDDYGEEDINFVKILPYSDSFVKLIFGSIDFNAYAYIPYLN